ncbi:thiamine ABC transporter substrate-binding protein [Oceanithermus desulfurans]|uniref:ABC transporter substrate-binding protein n=2 Tax=Oceanithermus desulfurans TaxID=227924 RepID=A0A511RJI9_9DEIN|nr:thiamine ABC transporter substrate-binding protein [Oceanithermus desulfurans]MBB6029864.1 thiamine transport system substrate-binding protein [Oceanithermus desulfurans]GEM89825.1 ABC transporter substrate-binding protein [Oceanithermus desulfurans NBRC 100063]
MLKKLLFLVPLVFGLALAETLVVLTHSSFALSKEVIASFEQETGIKLRFVEGGDAGETLNKAILSKGAPIADVIYGIDNTFLSRALAAGILERYSTPAIGAVQSRFLLDPTLTALPVDYGYVALNYDKDYFKDQALPRSWDELARPEYARLLVVENPATSSPGLAFLLATVASLGEDGYLRFWERLREGGVKVAPGWSEAYFAHFTRYGGDRPLVVSYTTSPAAEVYFSEGKYSEPPTGNLLWPGASFLQVEFVGILKGTKHRAAAEKFVDWLLSKPVQEDIPLNMWVWPVRRDAKLPEVFEFAERPLEPAELSPEAIAKNRERWISEWEAVVVRGRSAEEVIFKRK